MTLEQAIFHCFQPGRSVQNIPIVLEVSESYSEGVITLWKHSKVVLLASHNAAMFSRKVRSGKWAELALSAFVSHNGEQSALR